MFISILERYISFILHIHTKLSFHHSLFIHSCCIDVTEVICSYKTNNSSTFCDGSASNKSCKGPIRLGVGFLVVVMVMAAMLMMVQLAAIGMTAMVRASLL